MMMINVKTELREKTKKIPQGSPWKETSTEGTKQQKSIGKFRGRIKWREREESMKKATIKEDQLSWHNWNNDRDYL
jgi:hypothetical protein